MTPTSRTPHCPRCRGAVAFARGSRTHFRCLRCGYDSQHHVTRPAESAPPGPETPDTERALTFDVSSVAEGFFESPSPPSSEPASGFDFGGGGGFSGGGNSDDV
ncbi:hypothetical protein tb265_20330 [Gemmatimonadetes bacterium T265]|nr:hypothetical protein tb265_20330 [Gemmatimonadetes bacterium T265]